MNDYIKQNFDDAVGTTRDTTFRSRRAMERQYGELGTMDQGFVSDPGGFGFDRASRVYDTGGYDPETLKYEGRMPTLGPEVLAAMRLFRDQGGQSPSYGFQPQSQPEYIGFIKQLIAGLNDPRTQALLAPGMALTKAPQAAWNVTRVVPNMASERGNFNPFGWLARPNSMDPRPELNMNVPLSHMNEQIKGIESPKNFVGHIEDINKISRIMREGSEATKPMSAEEQIAYLAQIRATNKHLADRVEDTTLGQRSLQMQDNAAWSEEGPPPPEMIRRLFGFER